MDREEQTLKIIRSLINEVTDEIKSGIIKESLEAGAREESEEKLLKEYVTKRIVKVLKESGD
jgi:uncharacterized phage protein gp47/JayE